MDRDIKNQLAEALKHKRLTLFLGAGASITSGLPSSSSLVELLVDHFTLCDFKDRDLFNVFKEILDTPPYKRSDIEDYLEILFQDAQPSNAHIALTKIAWKAIFTTNYDDLIELSYRTSTIKVQTGRPVEVGATVNYSEPHVVNIYKLMGSFRKNEDGGTNLVLDQRNFYNMLLNHKSLIKILRDNVYSGTVIYSGYSFSDNIINAIVSEVIQNNYDRVGYSYAAIPDVKKNDKLYEKLYRNKIIAFDCTFEELIDEINSLATYQIPAATILARTVSVANVAMLKLSSKEYKDLSEQCVILEDELINADLLNHDYSISDFYKGGYTNWKAYNDYYDIARDKYEEIKNTILNYFASDNAEDNKGIVITGTSGCGKSVLIRRVCWDLFNEKHIPIFFLREDRLDHDFKVIDHNLRQLQNQNSIPGLYSTKALIVLDNVPDFIERAKRLFEMLLSRGRIVTIILVCRNNEYLSICKENEIKYENNVWKHIEIDERISSEELQRLIASLKSNRLLPSESYSNKELLNNIVFEECKGNFFVLLYRLVKDFSMSFESIIRSEYNNLGELSKLIYRQTCLFHQYDLSLVLEWMVRGLECTYPEFLDLINDGDLRDVVREKIGPKSEILYESRHRLISESVISQIHSNSIMSIYSMFKNILAHVNSANPIEVETVRRLFAKVLGPNGVEYKTNKRVTEDEVRSLFDTVLERIADDQTILHHYGLFEYDNGRYEHAEELLLEAISIEKKKSIRRTERIQNINVTLGMLYYERGEYYQRQNKHEQAENEYEKAEKLFKSARLGEYPNFKAYVAHAKRIYWRASRCFSMGDVQSGKALIVQGLEIVDQGYETISDDDGRSALHMQEAEMIAALGNTREAIEKIEKEISKSYGDPNKHYLLAKLHLIEYSEFMRRNEKEKAQDVLFAVLDALNTGLYENPDSRKLLRLKSYAFKLKYPNKKQELYQILLKRYSIPEERDCLEMLYDLGRLSFELSPKDCVIFFRELADNAYFHRKRRGVKDVIKDENGNDIKRTGVVISDSTRHLVRDQESRINLYFEFRKQKITPSEGEYMRYSVGFNYAGPIALDLERV